MCLSFDFNFDLINFDERNKKTRGRKAREETNIAIFFRGEFGSGCGRNPRSERRLSAFILTIFVCKFVDIADRLFVDFLGHLEVFTG
jgi:hypothetical protein